MKYIAFFTTLFVLLVNSVMGQKNDSLVKYEASYTGVIVNFPEEPAWQPSWSEDSSKVLSAFTVIDNIGYGAIVVKFSSSLGDNATDWQSILESYIQYLNKTAFLFESENDPILSNTLSSGQKVASYFVEGVDLNGYTYFVQGWANASSLSVMYLSFDEFNYPNFEVMNSFLQDVTLP